MKAEGVGFIHPIIIQAGLQVIFIYGALADTRQEAFPEAGLSARRQRMAGFFPAVEIAHDKNLFGVRGPDGKIRPGLSVGLHDMGAQFVIESEMIAFVKEIQVISG